jgi:hypothetical protein
VCSKLINPAALADFGLWLLFTVDLRRNRFSISQGSDKWITNLDFRESFQLGCRAEIPFWLATNSDPLESHSNQKGTPSACPGKFIFHLYRQRRIGFGDVFLKINILFFVFNKIVIAARTGSPVAFKYRKIKISVFSAKPAHRQPRGNHTLTPAIKSVYS